MFCVYLESHRGYDNPQDSNGADRAVYSKVD